jgi:hypothetical protein
LHSRRSLSNSPIGAPFQPAIDFCHDLRTIAFLFLRMITLHSLQAHFLSCRTSNFPYSSYQTSIRDRTRPIMRMLRTQSKQNNFSAMATTRITIDRFTGLPLRALAVAMAAAVCLLLACAPKVYSTLFKPTSARITHPAIAALPANMLWAWQRPEDLRDLPAQFGVAYVAFSIELARDQTKVTPRQHALRVGALTRVVPVVHVDASWREPPSLEIAQRDAIVDALVRAAQFGNANAVQLDFEVRRSQRAFFAGVVSEARRRLPPNIALSMTALASWCEGDDWLAGMPVDEIVPMAFRMSQGDHEIRAALARRGNFKASHCRAAIGSATDELPVAGLNSNRLRRYFFSPRSWTQSQWQTL